MDLGAENGPALVGGGTLPYRCPRGEIVPRLNQIIAVEKGVKSKSFADLTEAHHAVRTLAPTSAFATERRVERARTVIVGCWFKSSSPLQRAAVV
jgi:hypothetical protein